MNYTGQYSNRNRRNKNLQEYDDWYRRMSETTLNNQHFIARVFKYNVSIHHNQKTNLHFYIRMN